jgi:OCT family organic cation transporter-like MFS transporter 18
MADTYNLSPAEYGYLLSFAGVVGMVVQAVGVRAARDALSGFQITATAALLLVVSFLGFAFSGSIAHIYLVMVPITVASTLLGAVNSAQQVAAAKEDRGTVVAVDMGMGSGVRILSPKIVAWLVGAYGWSSVGSLASLLMVVFLVAATYDGGLLDELLQPVAIEAGEGAADGGQGETKKDK